MSHLNRLHNDLDRRFGIIAADERHHRSHPPNWIAPHSPTADDLSKRALEALALIRLGSVNSHPMHIFT
jgi:hypothetical protein